MPTAGHCQRCGDNSYDIAAHRCRDLRMADCTCTGIQTETTCPVHGALAPPRDLGPGKPPADADVTTGPVGTGEVDISETVIDVILPDGSALAHKFKLSDPRPVDTAELDLRRFGEPVDSAEDIVDAELVEEPAPDDLAAGDRQAAEMFRELLRTGSAQHAVDRLYAYLVASEPVRSANPDGDVTPLFGLGEPPSLEVAAISVDGWYRSQLMAMHQRRLTTMGLPT